MNHKLRAGRLMLKASTQTALRRLRMGPLQPSWSFSFEVVVSFLKLDWQTLWQLDAVALRAYLDSLPGSDEVVKRCARRAETIGGVPGEWFLPPNAREDTALLYFHGGSYLFGSLKTHGDVIARFAIHSGLAVFAPLYRLAPEHPWPAPLEDARAVFQGLASRRLVLAGESAGGHLVLCLARELYAQEGARPVATVALSPWLDMSAQSDSYQRNAAFDYGTREMLLAQARLVLAGAPPESMSLSDKPPLLAGPLLLQAGGAELLHDEIAHFAAKMKEAGHPAALEVLPEMPHAASNLAAFCPTGDRAIQSACAFLQQALSAH